MDLGRIGSILPRLLIGGVVLGGIALVATSCAAPKRRPEEEAADLLYSYDRGKTGADQARTGEQSLSLDGENRRIDKGHKQLQDRGYYTDGYKKFDEVQDITKLIKAADANNSLDATKSELAAKIASFDKDNDGSLDDLESADYQIEFGPERSQINVRMERDLNEDGADAAGEVAGGLIDAFFGSD